MESRQLLALIFFLTAASPALPQNISGQQSGTWSLAGSPYIVDGDVTVPVDSSLYIQSGVIVKFTGPYVLRVRGSLHAEGTPANQIVFTSINDDSFFPSGQERETAPAVSDWKGIVLEGESGTPASTMRNTMVLFASNPLRIATGQVSIERLVLYDCERMSIDVEGAAFPVEPGAFFSLNTPATPVAGAPADNADVDEAGIAAIPVLENAVNPEIPSEEQNAAASEANGVEPGFIRGTVSDLETGEPLPAVSMLFIPKGTADRTLGTASGFGGYFSLDRLPPATYDITASYIGYESGKMRVSLASGDTMDISLALTPASLLFSNPITVTASRRPETLFDAPAAISVLSGETLIAQTALTPADYLKGQSSVDFATTGLNADITALRGFNNVFTGALLSLVDNRIAHVPSLRLNAYQFLPSISEDIERVELVSGPGSALYGPNSANGVMHIITKSPFESEGTTVTAAGGERSVMMGSVRHAKAVSDRFGYRLSAEFMRGRDWLSEDEEEVRARDAAIAAGADPAALKIGARDFDVDKFGAHLRLDYAPAPDKSLVLNGDFMRANNIELTGLGAAQVADWTYFDAQARLTYKNLFAQAFVNATDAGNTFLLRSGNPIVDKSRFYVAQIQHGFSAGDRQRFTYGIDVLRTRPDTEATVNGRNESSDDVNEIGAYIQSETDLSPTLKLVAAGRVDDHNRIEKTVFSPRAALLFRPRADQALRLTFNRAFSTPTTNNLFLDILQERTPNPFPAALRNALDLDADLVNIRVQGVPAATGFTFDFGDDGRARMQSQFDGIDGYAPATINTVWPKLRSILVASNPQLGGLLPDQLSVDAPLAFLNPATGVPVANPVDVAPIRETTTNSIEFGYKGALPGNLVVELDVYRTHIENFVSPLLVATPTAHAARQVIGPVLEADIAAGLVAGGAPAATAQATARAVVDGLYDPASPLNLERLPLGVVTPREIGSDVSIIATYRNFGDVWLTGADLRVAWIPSASLTLRGNYSFVNRDLFRNLDGIADIALNAPRHKMAAEIAYQSQTNGFSGRLRLRRVAGFPVNSGTFVGEVESYAVTDLYMGTRIVRGTRVGLSVRNLLDSRHREFVGAPAVGRLALVQMTQTF